MRRLALICVAMAAILAGVMSPTSASAFGWDRGDGYSDPYFYRPSARGYYPYYNSGQWRSAREMRWKRRLAREDRFEYPQYNPVWGHPLDGYDHRAWHRRHHGRHRLGHW
jgi:hypothetical protein